MPNPSLNNQLLRLRPNKSKHQHLLITPPLQPTSFKSHRLVPINKLLQLQQMPLLLPPKRMLQSQLWSNRRWRPRKKRSQWTPQQSRLTQVSSPMPQKTASQPLQLFTPRQFRMKLERNQCMSSVSTQWAQWSKTRSPLSRWLQSKLPKITNENWKERLMKTKVNYCCIFSSDDIFKKLQSKFKLEYSFSYIYD